MLPLSESLNAKSQNKKQKWIPYHGSHVIPNVVFFCFANLFVFYLFYFLVYSILTIAHPYPSQRTWTLVPCSHIETRPIRVLHSHYYLYVCSPASAVTVAVVLF